MEWSGSLTFGGSVGSFVSGVSFRTDGNVSSALPTHLTRFPRVAYLFYERSHHKYRGIDPKVCLILCRCLESGTEDRISTISNMMVVRDTNGLRKSFLRQ